MATQNTIGSIPKYVPFKSSVDVSFWHEFTKQKLETYQLSSKPMNLYGSYVNSNDEGTAPRLSVSHGAFQSSSTSSSDFKSPGVLYHTNTIEEFRNAEKKKLLSDVAQERLWEALVSGRAIQEPHLLTPFLLFTFADLKRYKYTYWFGFPVYLSHAETLLAPIEELGVVWTKEEIASLASARRDKTQGVNEAFCTLQRDASGQCVFHPLEAYNTLRGHPGVGEVFLCIADPSSVAGVPGWPLRNLLSLAYIHWSSECPDHRVLCLREHRRRGPRSLHHSLLIHVRLHHKQQGQETQGQETQGQETQGQETQGQETQGQETQGHETQGHETQGQDTQKKEQRTEAQSLHQDTQSQGQMTKDKLGLTHKTQHEDQLQASLNNKSSQCSQVRTLDFQLKRTSLALPPCLGWEKNTNGKMAPMIVDLSDSMDSKKLADSACELTLQLMRWRLVPDLDLHKLKSTRCLLLGAGTLGCNVARALLGWNVSTITLVDSGRVSYSNPPRQSLYNLQDCLAGGVFKAPAAAAALKLVRPSLECHGEVLSIPMPGHPPGMMAESVAAAAVRLEQLVAQHDAVFLLMDSRESRWLPALIGASLNKIVITAALGFDSYVVIRHGSRPRSRRRGPSAESAEGTATSATDDAASGSGTGAVARDKGSGGGAVDCSVQCVAGQDLGCYFCNDVVAPGNSQADRSLDQQCTVSRPGISMMAAAQAVELLASILQHPLGNDAPSGSNSSEGVLGPVPHSLRYFLPSHHLLPLTTPAFTHCSACGEQVLAAYERDGSTMLMKVFESPRFLEEVCGIAELHERAKQRELQDDMMADWETSSEGGQSI